MSWQATAWAKATTGHKTISEKFLLMVLADYAHPETHEAWPSIKALERDCMGSKMTIIRGLNALERRGFIARKHKGNQHSASVYTLNIKMIPSSDSEGIKGESTKMIPSSEGITQSIVKVSPVSDATLYEPPMNLQREGTPRKPKAETSITPEFISTMVEEFAPKLGGVDRAKRKIENALNHKAMDKAKNKRQRLRSWLEEDAEKYTGGTNGRFNVAQGQLAEWKPDPVSQRILDRQRAKAAAGSPEAVS